MKDVRCSHVFRLVLGLTPLSDVIAPPFTSKLVRSSLLSCGLDYLEKLGSRSLSYKRVFISPILVGGKPIYKRFNNKSNAFIVLRQGREYSAFFSAMVGEEELENLLDRLDEYVVETPYGHIRLIIKGIKITSLRELDISLGEVFKVKFLTPTMLSNKLMIPPKIRGIIRNSVIGMVRLLPSPSLLFSYLTILWNRNVIPDLILPKPGYNTDEAAYKIGRIADIFMVEIDHDVETLTVLYDKKGDAERKIRGFVGWVLYRVAYKGGQLPRVLRKLLALANYMGVGRSRGIGMGMIRIEPVSRKEANHKT